MSKGASHRHEQVAEAIRTAVARALTQGEVRDPRVGLVTVSHVEVTRDLSHATVYVMPHGNDEAKEAAVEGLRNAASFLRRIVARQLTTRNVPDLHIKLDRGLEHAQQINKILAELHQDDVTPLAVAPEEGEDGA